MDACKYTKRLGNDFYACARADIGITAARCPTSPGVRLNLDHGFPTSAIADGSVLNYRSAARGYVVAEATGCGPGARIRRVRTPRLKVRLGAA